MHSGRLRFVAFARRPRTAYPLQKFGLEEKNVSIAIVLVDFKVVTKLARNAIVGSWIDIQIINRRPSHRDARDFHFAADITTRDKNNKSISIGFVSFAKVCEERRFPNRYRNDLSSIFLLLVFHLAARAFFSDALSSVAFRCTRARRSSTFHRADRNSRENLNRSESQSRISKKLRIDSRRTLVSIVLKKIPIVSSEFRSFPRTENTFQVVYRRFDDCPKVSKRSLGALRDVS